MQSDEIPIEIKKFCLVLGLDSDSLTKKVVIDSWKQGMIASPDDVSAVLVNSAKDALLTWLRHQNGGDPRQSNGVPRKPLPFPGSGAVALPLLTKESEDQ